MNKADFTLNGTLFAVLTSTEGFLPFSLVDEPDSCDMREELDGPRVGLVIGLVRKSSETSSSVSKTKKASPASPIFIANGTVSPLTER